mmetsp:Transcript_9035/g.13523  ORF Transcript_9035/g.13523 Transcript_9035/m.13523 type:complete len:202 (-) Transcript_9035:248-853(-)
MIHHRLDGTGGIIKIHLDQSSHVRHLLKKFHIGCFYTSCECPSIVGGVRILLDRYPLVVVIWSYTIVSPSTRLCWHRYRHRYTILPCHIHIHMNIPIHLRLHLGLQFDTLGRLEYPLMRFTISRIIRPNRPRSGGWNGCILGHFMSINEYFRREIDIGSIGHMEIIWFSNGPWRHNDICPCGPGVCGSFACSFFGGERDAL